MRGINEILGPALRTGPSATDLQPTTDGGESPAQAGLITGSAAAYTPAKWSTGGEPKSMINNGRGLIFGPEQTAHPSVAGAPMSRKPQVLAIDDEGHQLASVRRVLRRSGIEVTCATGGAKALRLTASRRPDLILVDVSMPGMSGHEFVRRFRKQERELHARSEPCVLPVPVIFVSGRSGLSHRLSGLDAGGIDYIVKPIVPEDLRARVRTHLRWARSQQEHVHTFVAPVGAAA